MAETKKECPKCGHPLIYHYLAEGWGTPVFQCWERDHPHCSGRCGCRYGKPAKDLYDHLMEDNSDL